MVAITFISHAGERQTVDIASGQTLMEGAIATGVAGIDALCGGNCQCGTCRVHVAAAWRERIDSASHSERDMIALTDDDDPAVRLSCQIVVEPGHEGLVVHTPESQQ